MPVTAPPAPAFVDVVTEMLYYSGLALPVGIGMTIAFLAVPEVHGGVVAPRVRALAPAAAVFVAVSAGVHVLTAPASRGNSGGQTLMATAQIVAYLLVVVALLMLWKRPSRPLAGGLTALAVITAAIPSVSFVAPTLDGTARNLLTLVHVLGALFWIGGLVVLATVGMLGRRARRRDPDSVDAERSSQDWGQIWERFTVVALWAVGALITSGSWLAWTHVGTPVQLLTTPYGRYLTVKLVLVGIMLGAGAYNARVLLPRIAAAQRDGDDRGAVRIAVAHLPVVVVAEAVLALAVLAVVPFLRGSARTEAGWPSAGGFDLTVFGTGLVLVALVAFSLWWGSRRPQRVAVPSR
ncbi:CopD family protein [Mycolicibacterium sp.]|uniref:copper resistance D family protein n=1 Tax=Mycolicibacterium sp. TaxID=2320850 RepID=UPI001A21E02F|nr:CopD family protein [Mycolicibacterium sp.]MBJ7339832.1 CopD family protein [Mycolicibacterium sp.]